MALFCGTRLVGTRLPTLYLVRMFYKETVKVRNFEIDESIVLYIDFSFHLLLVVDMNKHVRRPFFFCRYARCAAGWTLSWVVGVKGWEVSQSNDLYIALYAIFPRLMVRPRGASPTTVPVKTANAPLKYSVISDDSCWEAYNLTRPPSPPKPPPQSAL